MVVFEIWAISDSLTTDWANHLFVHWIDRIAHERCIGISFDTSRSLVLLAIWDTLRTWHLVHRIDKWQLEIQYDIIHVK